MKRIKTTAMRILDTAHIAYTLYTYEFGKEHIDGNQVALSLNQNPDRVFKTLICKSASKKHYVFVIPVNYELDLKKAAKAVHEKSVEMLPMKDLLPTTGYVHGGCSPIGMKKTFITTFDESSRQFETIIFSAGKRGYQIEVNIKSVIDFLNATTVNLIQV